MVQIADEFREKCAYLPALMVGALVDSMPYPLIVRDPDSNIVLANKAAETYYGWYLLHCKCHDRTGFKECLCDDCPAHEAAVTGKPVEREVRHPETGDYLVVGIYPMFDANGEFCGIIETARDVTEMRRSMDRISNLLEQVMLQKDELEDWRRSFEYQLRTAREIQMMLVPDRPVCIARTCFDFLYRPSGEVGGDLYDVLPLSEDRVGMLVSDASGHGVAAALIAAMLKVVFRSPAADRQSPTAVMQSLNRLLVELSPTSQFATAFYGVHDAAAGELLYASAGHPAPLVIRGDGDTVESLDEGGLVLGTVEDLAVEETAIPFGRGDRLLVYTDGVTDAANERGDRFGQANLERLVERCRAQHGRAFLGLIVEGVEAFIGDVVPADDLTMVLAEAVDAGREEEFCRGGDADS